MNDAYEALRHGAAVVDRTDRGLIAVGGSDRAEYLQGQLTNDIAALEDGAQCYAAYLTPQGRLITDMEVLSIVEHLLLDVHEDSTAALVAKFGGLVFTEDVEFADWTNTWLSCGVTGPAAPERLTQALRTVDVGPTGLDFVMSSTPRVGRCTSRRGDLIVARTDSLGGLGFDLWVEREVVSDLRRALAGAGCVAADRVTVDTFRIENGRPVFPVDMNDRTIPLEAGIESRAISFDKGCYVGQEVIIRIMHRGQGRVARRLVGLKVEATELASGPGKGARLWHDNAEVGQVTSVTWSPLCDQVIALAYVGRDLAHPDVALEFDSADGRRRAVVTALPFTSG